MVSRFLWVSKWLLWPCAIACLAACAGAGPAAAPRACAAPETSAQPAPSPRLVALATQLTIPELDRARRVRIYLPPGYATSGRRYPVLYMHDGQNLFADAADGAASWAVDETLDALAQSDGLELIVVAVDHGGVHRTTELNPWDHARFGKGEGRPYMDFVVNVVKPMVDAGYRTLPGREHTGVMGSSLGGLISHYAVLQYPKVFSKAGILSPAYWPAPEVYRMTTGQAPAPDVRIALYMGSAEGEEAVTDYQRMVLQLERQSHPATKLWLRLKPGAGHNEAAWRSEFGSVVSWMFARE